MTSSCAEEHRIKSVNGEASLRRRIGHIKSEIKPDSTEEAMPLDVRRIPFQEGILRL
jgi:hypothetical protein